MESRAGLMLGGVLLLVSVLMVRIPSDPESDPSLGFFAQPELPSQVAEPLKRACADCHSNQTRWPWYVYVPGPSLQVTHDVAAGREQLNFSNWRSVRQRGPAQVAASLSGICDSLQSGDMPKQNYAFFHPNARLSHEEISTICSWTDKEQLKALHQTATLTNP